MGPDPQRALSSWEVPEKGALAYSLLPKDSWESSLGEDSEEVISAFPCLCGGSLSLPDLVTQPLATLLDPDLTPVSMV